LQKLESPAKKQNSIELFDEDEIDQDYSPGVIETFSQKIRTLSPGNRKESDRSLGKIKESIYA